MTLVRTAAIGVATLLVGALSAAGCGHHSATIARPHQRAEVVAEQRVGPRLLDLTIESPALGAKAKVRLLTPRGWSPTVKHKRWPVLYLLHGCCDTYRSWTRSAHVEKLEQLRDVLVVMPEGGEIGFYSNWRRGPGWADFHLVELRRILERHYGAGPRRAIAGLSMGGLGSMLYSAQALRPFRAAASFSGLLHPLDDTGFMLGLFSAYTSDPLAIWGDPEADRRVWQEHDPTALAARLRGTALFVSSGNGRPGPFEPPGARVDRIEQVVSGESQAFVARLRALRIPVQTDFYGAGGHRWRYFKRELERALPLLLHALGPRQRAAVDRLTLRKRAQRA